MVSIVHFNSMTDIFVPIFIRNFLLIFRGVDESGFLEPNWSHGTKLERFWDGDLGPLERVLATFVG